ncbi:MAG: LysE family transporter [Verrucomicrobiia bacterium]|jgi:threonine/homoserine/homoserine lactone efflux protein
MTAAFVSGILLGLSCGLSPGVLLTLVLTQTLRHGAREGCKVALAPLGSDLPIVLLAMLFASKVSAFRPVLGVISIAGGAYVLYLAWESFRPARVDADAPDAQPRSWSKGVFANLLNPNPWLFWFTVGAATLGKTMAESWLAAAVFLVCFYALLVGGKLCVAVLAAKSRTLLTGGGYRLIMRTLGVLLAAFALFFFWDGLKYLGIISGS